MQFELGREVQDAKEYFDDHFLFFIICDGGAPTIAMMIIRAQTEDPQLIYQALIGLSVIIACILVPIVLYTKCCPIF